MILKILNNNKLIGFSYYPLLENVLGIFFLFVAFFVPILFFRYNGFKTQQWDEWLFLLFFFLLFFFLGKNLSYQNMRVEIKNERIFFNQDMREPPVNLDFDLEKWKGIDFSTVEENKEEMHFIRIKTDSDIKEFYQTRSYKEAKQIGDMLINIYKEYLGVENGTE